MDGAARIRIEGVLGSEVVGSTALSGGCVGDVRLIELVGGDRVVAKLDTSGSGGGSGGLAIEGRMLTYLAERTGLPTPRVIHAESGLLVMEHIQTDGHGGASGEQHAAELLAELHGIQPEPDRDGGAGFGFSYDTLIGGLPQANPWGASWISFFAEHRLKNMARQAHAAGQIDAALLARVERFADGVGDYIQVPGAPSLLHGDVWSGNVLFNEGRVGAFIDPAIYYGHAEIELAFIGMFDTFGPAFYKRYNELRPIAPGFFETRAEVYRLFPLLVHARLFGGSYVQQIDRTLARL